MKEDTLKIINHYSVMHQLKKFQEEVFELNEAIILYECIDDSIYFSTNRNHITEEIADCYVMLEQFCNYYDISEEEIIKIMEYKIDRQLKRIETEV